MTKPRDTKPPVKILLWGTFDRGKPRVRILERGLRENDCDVSVIHVDVWNNIEDKSQIKGLLRKLYYAVKWLAAYPVLIFRFLTAKKHDVVLVPYLGHFDVLVLWPFAKVRGIPIIWDAFISLYNTVVEDRKLVKPSGLLAKTIWGFEWLICRLADHIVLDTQAHCDYFREQFHLDSNKLSPVFVGVEPEHFPVIQNRREAKGNIRVLFYGQFIPLHGVDTIIDAAYLARDLPIHWTLIGKGQEADSIRSRLEKDPLQKLTWIEWVDYGKLADYIREADVCLGIFSDSVKAGMVIPNKVFQVLQGGSPLITRDSDAIRELFQDSALPPGLYMVEAKSPQALLENIVDASDAALEYPLFVKIRSIIQPNSVGNQMIRMVRKIYNRVQ